MATIDKKSNQNYKRKEFLHFGALITINCSDLPFQMASDGFIEKTISLKTTLNEQNNSQQQQFQQENNKNPVSPKKSHNKNEIFNQYIDKQENFSPKKKAQDYTNNMNNFDVNSFEKSISNKPESAYNQKQNNKLIKNGLYDNIFRIVPTFPKINNLDKNATDKEIIENYDRQINERLKYLANTTVSYGQDFQLQHYKSHKFLCYSNNEKSLNQKGYQLQLKEQSDLTCHFEIRPCYNFQQEITNNIRFYDDVYIVSISKFTEKDAFISIQEDKESKQTLHQIFSQQEQKDTSSDSDIKESDEEEDSDSSQNLNINLNINLNKNKKLSAQDNLIKNFSENQIVQENTDQKENSGQNQQNQTNKNLQNLETTSLKKQNIVDDFDESESDLITSKKSENLKSPKKKFAFNLKQVTSVKEKNETFKKQKQLLKLSQKNYKAYRSQFQKSKFQMHLYRKYYDESGIYLGNCVWISFPQKDTYFTYDSLHKIVKLEKRMDGEYNNSLGLFILEGQKQNDGGKVIFSQTKFKLKNLCNGKYVYVKNALSYKDLNLDFYNQALEEQSIIPDQENEEDYKNDMENFEDKNFSKIFGFSQQPKPSSYFIIQDMYQDYHKQKTVQQSSIFYLKNCLTNQYVVKELCPQYINTYQLKFSTKSNQEDALKFHKANSKEVWEEQILISCMKILNEGKIQLNKISSLLLEQKEKSDQYNKLINNIDIINQFEDESQNFQHEKTQTDTQEKLNLNQTKQQIKLVKKCLKTLYDFINDCSYGEPSYYSQVQGQQYQDKAHIYFRRQLILRQHGYFKYLTQILVACFPDEGVLKHIPERNPLKQLNKNQKQQKLNKLSHSLSQDNINTALLQAKQKSMEEIEFIFELKDICEISYQLFKAICQDNLENKNICFKYMQILFYQIGYIQGPILVLNTLLKDNENLLYNLYNLKINAIMSQDEKTEDLNDLNSNKPQHLINLEILEIEKQMELYAFLCLGRNYHNSNEIKLLFPHEELITKIFNKSDINLTEQLKASLVLILLHVHIDSKPFIEQKKPQFTKILEKNNFQNAIINRSRSLSVGQNASNMSFILDQESINNQISDNSQQQINFNNNNQQLNTSENNSSNLNESLLAGPRIQLNQINNNNRNDSMHHQMIELQEQNTAAAQTLNIMMQQGFKDLKIRNILKHLTDYFKSALSKYTILNDESDNILEEKIQTEILRNIILFMDIKHDNYLQNIVDFIYESEQFQNFEEFEPYLEKNIQRFLPQTKQKEKKITIDTFLFNQKTQKGMKEFIQNLLINKFANLNNTKDNTFKELILKLTFMASYQLTNLIKSLHNLQILTSQFEVELFRNMQQKSIQLTFDGQQSEIWLNDSEKIRSQDYEYQDTIQRVIDTLKYFLNILNLDLDPIQRSSSQEEKISTILSRQIMIRNLETHHTVINILREANYILKQIKKIGEQDKLILDLFRSCYQFLYFFISSDNLQNKSILTPSLDFFINNLDLADVGQCKLIYELFHDNIQLIQTELDEKLVKKFLKQIENKRYHTRYLDFIWLTLEHTEDLSIYDKKIIEQLLFLSSEYLEENKPINSGKQNKLLNIFAKKQMFSQLSEQDKNKSKYNLNLIFNLSIQNADLEEQQPFLYHIKLLKIFNQFFQNNQKQRKDILISILKKILSIEKIFKFLQIPDIFSNEQDIVASKFSKEELILILLLKQQIYQLVLNLWRNDNQLSELLGDKQKFMTLLKFYEIETMKNPNKIFDFKKYQEELKTKSNNLEFSNIQKDSQIKKSQINRQKSSIFTKLKKNKQNLEEKVAEEEKEEEKNNENEKKEEKLTDYEKLILESDFTDLFNEYLIYQICYIFPILDMVASGSYSYEITKLMNPLYIYIKKFKDSFKKTPTNKFIENKYILESLIYIKQNSELKLEYKDQSIEDDLETLYLKFSQKNQQIKVKFNSPMAEMLMLQPKGQGNWREIILNIITSKYIKKQLWDEQQELINIILGITEYNQIVKLLTNLMQFVVDTVESQASQDSMNYEKSGQDEVLKNVVVVLRKIIVNCKNADLSQLRKESQIDQKRDLQKKVTISVNRKEDQNLKNNKGYLLLEQADFEKKNQRQLFLTIYLESGIVKMLIQNLCIFDISDQLFLEHIRLANVLLEEGDTNIQDVFYDYFINVSASENLFQKIKKYIDAEIQYITKQKNFNQLLDKSVEKLLKQSINGEENIDEDITHIIKFIQLLTEGHNTKLQNYIRVQENSRNSYNILEQLLSLAEILYENLSEQNYHIFMQVFDTIAELIQGPCQENQDYLSDSQFIQICSKILQTSIDIHNVGTKVAPSNNFNSQRKNTGNRFRQLFYQNSTSHQNNTLNQQNNQNLNQTLNQNSNQNQQQQLNFTPTKLDIYKKHSKQIFKIRYKYLNSDDSLRLLDMKEVQQQNQIEPITYEMIQVQKWVENINQEFSKKIGEVLLKQEQSFEPWMIRRLQNKMLICLESLTEGNQDDQIIKKLSKQVTFKLLLENLRFVYDQYIQMFRPILSQYRRIKYTQELYRHHTFHLKRPKYTSEFVITNGFKLYGLIKMYTDSANNQDSSHAVIQTIEFSSLDQKNQQNYFYALQFFSKFTGYVEIFNGSQIFKVYFPKPPYCTQSNQEYREEFENKVDRSSTKTKLTSFLESSQDMIDLMKFQQNIKEIKVGQYRIVGIIVWFLAKRVTLLRYFLFSLCILQNIILLYITKSDSPKFEMKLIINQQFPTSFIKYILLSLEILQIFFSLILFLIYLAFRINKGIQNIKHYKHIILKPSKKSQRSFFSPQIRMTKQLYILKTIFNDQTFYAYFCYFICTILGLYNSIFIGILLLDIFFLSPNLRTILSSIWRPKKQIFLTLVLLLIIQYLFSIIAYLAFHQDFIAEDDMGQMVSGCTDLISCWSIMFDSTFKYDGGFVGLFSWEAIQYIESDFVIDWKAIYDFLYNFIILVLVLEMLSGIIIDTFGELRSENEEKEKDRKNYCFICGLNRRDLDHLSAKQSFNEHTSIKHNMWNYLYYIAYIKDKPSTNYTGIETYVAECLKNNDISWFPIDENEENEDQPILEEIQNFSSQIDQMGEKFERLQRVQEKQFNYKKQQKEIQDIKQNISYLSERFDRIEQQNQQLITLLQNNIYNQKISESQITQQEI